MEDSERHSMEDYERQLLGDTAPPLFRVACACACRSLPSSCIGGFVALLLFCIRSRCCDRCRLPMRTAGRLAIHAASGLCHAEASGNSWASRMALAALLASDLCVVDFAGGRCEQPLALG
jgi:hypothetical protein